MSEKIYIQDYEIKGNILEIISGSGKKYQLTQKSCTCKGFSFRRTCGHVQEAEAKGLLRELEKRRTKKIRTLSRSENRIKARKDAIRKFLEKNGVLFDERTIDEIERILTQETVPEKVLEIARGKKNEF